ncbi:MAG: ABC transporter substrate-binding protein [Chloroflexota bacterium]|nr:ABC transporter substrate-binding protein [Chloroflexota bacterium]
MNRSLRGAMTILIATVMLWAFSGGTLPRATASGVGARAEAACPGGSITIDDFAPFSGPDADYGAITQLPGAVAAVHFLNQQGGVLGCRVKLIHTDSRGEPADAVPALNQMVATTHNLALVIGPTGDEVESVSPILNRDHLVELNQAGDVTLDHLFMKYNYRLTQSDSLIARAMGAAAILNGCRRGAMVFTSDVAGQGLVPSAIAAFKKGGGTVVANQPLQQDQPSYRSVILSLKAAHPQCIFTEEDERTAGTFFSQLKELNFTNVKVYTTDELFPAWNKAVRNGAGASFLVHNIITLQGKVVHTPATSIFVHAFQEVYPGKQPYQLYNAQTWDSIIVAALAMTKAHSWHSPDYVNDISSITNDVHGRKVYSYAPGMRLIKKGIPIQFIGASGSLVFDRWHSIGGAYQIDHWTANGHAYPVRILSAALLRRFAP